MVAIGIFSRILEPGKVERFIVPRDFVLTNVALGEDLADPAGRSVLKLTHFKVEPELDDDEDDFSDEDDDEELDDLEDLEDLEGDEAIEDNDDDDEEDSEMEETDVEVEVETVVLCSLTAGKNEQTVLNVTFLEQDEIAFTVTGSNVVHLTGNYIDQEPPHSHGDEMDDDYPEDLDDYSEGDFSDDDDMMSFDEDEEDLDNSRISEIPEHETVVAAKKAAAAVAAPAVKAEKKRSASLAGLEDEAAAGDTSMVSVASSSAEGLSKSQKKKLAKKLKGEDGEAAAAAAAAPVKAEKKVEKKVEAPVAKKEEVKKEEKKEKASNKKTLPSGLVIEDSKLGSGQTAKAGKKIGMRYIGKLANGKIFDQNTSGAPFKFVLGKGEVIKGWDVGVAGMAIGGERKLTIPAGMAYGSKALPGIPKNSTLHFDVKLVSVN